MPSSKASRRAPAAAGRVTCRPPPARRGARAGRARQTPAHGAPPPPAGRPGASRPGDSPPAPGRYLASGTAGAGGPPGPDLRGSRAAAAGGQGHSHAGSRRHCDGVPRSLCIWRRLSRSRGCQLGAGEAGPGPSPGRPAGWAWGPESLSSAMRRKISAMAALEVASLPVTVSATEWAAWRHSLAETVTARRRRASESRRSWSR